MDVVAALLRALPRIELVWAGGPDARTLMTERGGAVVPWTPPAHVFFREEPVTVAVSSRAAETSNAAVTIHAAVPTNAAAPEAAPPAVAPVEPAPLAPPKAPFAEARPAPPVLGPPPPEGRRLVTTRAAAEREEAEHLAYQRDMLSRAEDAERRRSLEELRTHASWENISIRALRAQADAHLARFPADGDEVRDALAHGVQMREDLRVLFELARRRRNAPDDLAALMERTRREAPHLLWRLQRQIEFLTRTIGNANACRVVARGEHRLPALTPSGAWKLVVDETGERFHAKDGQGREGRFVMVAIPDGVSLPAMATHGADVEQAEGDACMQALLDAPVGVLGIRVAHLALDRGFDWEDGIIELLALGLRLLPMPDGDEPVNVSVVVEQRGDRITWDLARRALTRELAHADPVRARRLRLDISTVQKGGDPHLAYADIVAHAWGASRPDAKERLRRSNLAGSCLLTGDHAGRRYRRALDAVRPGTLPDATTWWWLISQPGATKAHTIANVALSAAARELATGRHAAVWNAYVEHLLRELDGATPDLWASGQAAAWLMKLVPDDTMLPPRLDLALAMAQLALGNHTGTVAEGEADLQSKARALEGEAAPLACLVDLHVAVRLTNRFDFDGATAAIAHLLERDERISGIRYHGRVLSTLGQHLAFRGDNTAARARFVEALACFDRLGDRSVKAREREQTVAYLAIATMDDPSATVEEGRAALAQLLGSLEPDAIEELALGGDAQRFKLHVLLRWLADHPDDPLIEVVVGCGASWSTGEEHPWQLIEFYRGALLAQACGWEPDPAGEGPTSEALRQCITRARDGARNLAPTLHAIGLVMGLAGKVAGIPFPAEQAEVDAVLARVPRARPWIEAAQQAATTATRPLDVMKAGLPFNFR